MFASAYMGRKRIPSNAFTPGSKKHWKGCARLCRPMYAGANMGHPSREKASLFALVRLAGGSGRGGSRSAFRLRSWLVSGSLISSTLVRSRGAPVRATTCIPRFGGGRGLGGIVRGVETRALEMGTGRRRNQPFHFALANRAFFYIWGRKGLDPFKSMSALFALVFV
jgi:hypothetical protein